MVTGDFHHTAIAVARGLSMIPQGRQVVIIQARSEMHHAPSHLASALKSPRPAAGTHSVRRAVSFAQSAFFSPSTSSAERAEVPIDGQPAGHERSHFGRKSGLVFTLDTEDDEMDGMQALTMIAEVCLPWLSMTLRCRYQA